MKNILSIVLFFLISISPFLEKREENNYYYYKNEKIFLQENSNRILLKLSTDSDKTDILRILNSEPNYKILKSDIRQGEYIVLQSQPNVSYEAKLNSLKQLKAIPNIVTANFMLYLPEKDHFIGFADEFFVKLHSSTTNDAFNQLLNQYGCEVVKQDQYDGDIFTLKITSDSPKNALKTSVDFYDTGLFDFAEPNFMQKTITYTNDPLYGDQWALNNTGQSGGSVGADIDMNGAWQITSGRADIRIAVVDGGVDLTHPDLIDNLVPGYDASGDGTNGGPVDAETHGTNCAGIVSAVANNNEGLAGVANRCALVPVSFDVLDAFDSEVIDAVNWAWDEGRADVISNSWGRYIESSMIDAAINNAATFGRDGLGSVVLFAVGNDNQSQIAYPSGLPSVIAVGASDACDARWDPTPCGGGITGGGSNRGEVDLVAPGVKLNTTHNGGGYVLFGGTSAATPVAAGVAALVLSVNPCLTRNKVQQILELSCDKPVYESSWYDQIICYNFLDSRPHGTWNNEMGYGRINAFKAVQYAHTQNLIVGNNIGGSSDGSNGDRFKWVLTNSACHGIAAATYHVYRYEVYRDITFPLNYAPAIYANSNGFSAANPNGGTQWAQVTNITTTSARLRTFVYNVVSNSGQNVGWVPAHPLDVRFHYFITDGNIIPNIYLQNQVVSSGTYNYRAVNQISSGRNVTTSVPIGDYVVQGVANVDLKARNAIYLKEGTKIIPSTGGFFNAEVAPIFTCSQYPSGRLAMTPDKKPERRLFTREYDEKSKIGKVNLLDLKIYPNPTNEIINIDLGRLSDVNYKLYSLEGRLILSNEFKNITKFKIDLSNNESGVYFIKLNINGESVSKKIIKE